MTNFDSAYNVQQRYSFSPSIQIENSPRISFDLYEPQQTFDYPSPTSSVIIHHHPPQPVYSSAPAVSKLRQINNELCHTLAQCDLNTQSYRSPPSPHYHVHHYPISRSPSPPPPLSSSSSSDFEPISPKKSNARITYKVRAPRHRRRQTSLSQLDDLLISTSDVYSQHEPTTVDLYPTRDNGFVKRVRNRPDNQSPWLPDTPVRRYSFSETSTYRTPRTPRAPNYENQLLQPNSRLSNCRERPRRPHSSSAKSRVFSATAPVWRPSGSIKRSKFIGSNAPPSKPKPPPQEPVWNPTGTGPKTKQFRAFEPSKTVPAKLHEPIWHPPSIHRTEKPTRYFEPTKKPDLVIPIDKEPQLKTKTKTRINSADPKIKTRIANAESKVKDAWKNAPKPPIARPKIVKPQPQPKPKPKPPISQKKSFDDFDTGRSSIRNGPGNPQLQSTPKDQSFINPDDEVSAIFGEESPKPTTQLEITPPKPTTQREITPPKPTTKLEITPPKLPERRSPVDDNEIHNPVSVPSEGHRTPSPEPIDNDDEEEEEEEEEEPIPSSPPPITDKVHKTPSPPPGDPDEGEANNNEEAVDSFFE